MAIKMTMQDGTVIEGSAEELARMSELLGVKVTEQSTDDSTETITFEGEKYTLVDRKAQPGDVVYVTKDANSTSDIPSEEYYRVNGDGEIGNKGWKHPVYREHYERTTDTVKVYEPIAESTPEFKEGDRVNAITNGEFNDVKAGEVGEITEIRYDDRYGIRVDTDDNYDYFRPQDLEVVSESVAKLARYGRKPGEFKKGDIIRTKYYGLLEVDRFVEGCKSGHPVKVYIDGKLDAMKVVGCELIAPVESRVDLVE